MKYDYAKTQQLKADRASKLRNATEIVERAKTAGRDLDSIETSAVESAVQSVKDIDVELKAQSAAMLIAIAGAGGQLDQLDDANDGELFSDAQKTTLIERIRSKGNYSTLVKAPTLGGSLLPTTARARRSHRTQQALSRSLDCSKQRPLTGRPCVYTSSAPARLGSSLRELRSPTQA